jgi:hypothetical protein
MDRLRKALSRLGPPLAGALLIAALAAGGAQAQTISPNNTTIKGIADNPYLNYGSQIIVCDSSTAVGTTGTDSHFVDVELDFQEPCRFDPGGWHFIPTCSDASGPENEYGTMRLKATDGLNDLGEVDRLNEGFYCEFTIPGLCTFTIDEQELPFNHGANSANLLNESSGEEAIDMDWDIEIFNTNSLCGPVPSGSGGFAGVYELDTAVSFDDP